MAQKRTNREEIELIEIDDSELLDVDDDGKDRKGIAKKILKAAGRVLITLLVTVVIILGGIYALMCVLVYGPSKTAQEQFIMSLRETSAIGFMANWFFTEDQVKAIIEKNSIKDTDEITDTNLITVVSGNVTGENNSTTEEIEVIDIKGKTYRGKLMIIKDPSRVFVGTVPSFFNGDGKVVSKIAAQYDAIAGINGGEFVDGDLTYTAMPIGLVMTDGNIVNGDTTTRWHVTGFTKDNILVVGNMTGKQAIEMGMRDCVSIRSDIGPFLIVNGESQDVAGVGGGINPRTAIGQRADGAVLLLVADGRQVNTPGASYADLIYIMQKYGAVNASAMDGGTSTQMYYNGEVINTPYAPTGPRQCPTAFLVK